MSPHVDTALDQLRLADDAIAEPTREQLREGALAAALVHAVLALADEVRRAQPPMYQLVQVPQPSEFDRLVEEARSFKAP